MLINRRRSVRRTQLVPAHAYARTRRYRVVHHQRFVVAEIPVRQPEHQPVGQRVQLLARAQLRNACPASITSRAERRHRDQRRPCKRRIGRRRPVHVELPKLQVVRPEGHEKIRRTRWRSRAAVQVRRQQPAISRTQLETLRRRRSAGQHARAVQRAGPPANKRIPAEHVERHVIGVRPHTQLRIVVEIRHLKRIAIPGAGRIRCRRYRNALQIRRRADRKLRHHPALRRLVPHRHRVAIVVVLASPAKARPQRVPCRRSIQQRMRGFVKHRE